MKKFKFPQKIELTPHINESGDRSGRKPTGHLLEDEDELLVDKNNPKYKYIKPEDIADYSYLSYGEDQPVEVVKESKDEELPNLDVNKEKSGGHVFPYEIRDLFPENEGKIAVASIRPDEIVISRENVAVAPEEEPESDIECDLGGEPLNNKKYTTKKEVKNVVRAIRAAKGLGVDSDNRKTMTKSKEERANRGGIRQEKYRIDKELVQ